MLIRHTDKIRWIKEIDPQIFPDFGKNNTKKIKTLLETVADSAITHSFELLTREHIAWFEHLYNTNLATKHNPNPFDVYATTLGKEKMVHTYYILILRENGVPVGGTIFTLRPERLSMVYRTYHADWVAHTYKCTPALYAEFLATEHALAQDKRYLVHGVDSNPYGVHSHVGVAIFKLATGCHAEIKSVYQITESDLDALPHNSLVLVYPETGKHITDAYLIGTAETALKYEQLFKYPEQLHVTLYTPTV